MIRPNSWVGDSSSNEGCCRTSSQSSTGPDLGS